MPNLKNNPNSDQSNSDLDNNINNQVAKPAVNEVTTSRTNQDSYVQGRATEKNLQEHDRAIRDNRDTAWGPIIGILLGSLVALGIASMFIFSPRQEGDTIITPPPTEDSSESESESDNSPTIIDRTRETIREVPVPSTQEQPDVNINMPEGDSSPAPAPTPAPNTTNNTNIEVTPSQPESSQDAPASTEEPAQESEAPDTSETDLR